jgi:hypothetical protein
MFDVFYKSLSREEKLQFAKDIDSSHESIQITYLAKDPLKRKVPRIEKMILMIEASKGRLHMLLLIDYFVVQQMYAIMSARDLVKNKNKRRVSILDTDLE